MKRDIEPDFLGLPCTGKNQEKVARLQEEINARTLMQSFYRLHRKEQLLMAAMVTEMTTDRFDNEKEEPTKTHRKLEQFKDC